MIFTIGHSTRALATSLPAAGVDYRHFPGLGGLRRPRRESINTAWRNDSFRGYADSMGPALFEQAFEELLAYAQRATAAVMCAEAVWWHCHPRLVADALVARDVEVFHIVSRGDTVRHQLSPMARVVAGRVTHPGGSLQPPSDGERLNG